jgi:hypothetical protein|tara:strand:+ start:9094 stop:9477 length:384 start_codon:yes stop_codon:yes gene_type:complete
MKYHPKYPSVSTPLETVDQKTLDKWKKDKTEAMSAAYRLSRRLGQRDKDHAEHYRTYLDAKSDLAEIRRYERTGEWTGSYMPSDPPRELVYRIVAPAYHANGTLKSAPEGAVVDGFNRIVNDSNVKK